MLRIAACSYEGSLFGWNVDISEQEAGKDCPILLDYGFHASYGTLKTVAISKSGAFLAAAGANERICIYNLYENTELGELAGHSGSITNLAFYEDDILISASEDHTLYIWRVTDWEKIHILGGHKDTVTAFAIHPSGKLTLSVGKDSTFKIWNLVQGRCSLSKKIFPMPEFILWSPEGDYYLLASSRNMKLYHTADNALAFELNLRVRINQIQFFIQSQIPFVALICDNQTLHIVDIQGQIIKSFSLAPISTGRWKSFSIAANPQESENYIASLITSLGKVIVFNIGMLYQLCLPSLTVTILEDDIVRKRLSKLTPIAYKEALAKLELTEDHRLFATAIITQHQLPAEPRLIAVDSNILAMTKDADDSKENDRDEVEEEEKEEEGEEENKITATPLESATSPVAEDDERLETEEEEEEQQQQSTSKDFQKKKKKKKQRRVAFETNSNENDNNDNSHHRTKKSRKS
jgi:hypothetical protein